MISDLFAGSWRGRRDSNPPPLKLRRDRAEACRPTCSAACEGGPAASGVTGASPRSRSFDVSRFSSGIRAIAHHAPPRTDMERHRSAVETGTPTGTVPARLTKPSRGRL